VRFPERPGTQEVPYFFESLDYKANDRKLSGYVAEFQEIPAEKAKPHLHPGVELVYVMKGALTIKIGSEEFQLEAEDAIYFDSAVLHSYRRRGAKPCTGLIVTVP